MEESKIDQLVKSISSDKRRAVALILFALTAVVALVYISAMSLTAVPLFYSFLLAVSAVLNILFLFDVDGKKTISADFFVFGIVLNTVGFLLRTIQLGILGSWEYFAFYLISTISLLLLLFMYSKNQGSSNLICVLLILLALYSFVRFFTIRIAFIKGISYKLFHLADAFVFVAYFMVVIMTKDKLETISAKVGNYKKQIPSMKLCISSFAVIAVISLAIGVIKQMSREKKYQTPSSSNNSIDISAESTTEEEFPEIQIDFADSIKTEDVEMSFSSYELTDEVRTSPKTVLATDLEKDTQWFCVKGNIKNLTGNEVDISRSFHVEYVFDDKYTYGVSNLRYREDIGDNRVSPMEKGDFVMCAPIPNEVLNSYSKCSIVIYFYNGLDYTYTFKNAENRYSVKIK